MGVVIRQHYIMSEHLIIAFPGEPTLSAILFPWIPKLHTVGQLVAWIICHTGKYPSAPYFPGFFMQSCDDLISARGVESGDTIKVKLDELFKPFNGFICTLLEEYATESSDEEKDGVGWSYPQDWCQEEEEGLYFNTEDGKVHDEVDWRMNCPKQDVRKFRKMLANLK